MATLIGRLAGGIRGAVARQPLRWKVGASLIILLMLAVFGRCGVGGAAVRDLLWAVFPYETPIDCPQPGLAASLRFEVLDGGRYVAGWQDQAYAPGTQVRLSASASRPGWIAVFGINGEQARAVYPPGGDGAAAAFEPAAGAAPIVFTLGETPGAAVYTVVVSPVPFRLDAIRDLVQEQAPDLSAGLSLPPPVALPDGMAATSVRVVTAGG